MIEAVTPLAVAGLIPVTDPLVQVKLVKPANEEVAT